MSSELAQRTTKPPHTYAPGAWSSSSKSSIITAIPATDVHSSAWSRRIVDLSWRRFSIFCARRRAKRAWVFVARARAAVEIVGSRKSVASVSGSDSSGRKEAYSVKRRRRMPSSARWSSVVSARRAASRRFSMPSTKEEGDSSGKEPAIVDAKCCCGNSLRSTRGAC